MADQESVAEVVGRLAHERGRLLLHLAYQLTHDRTAAQDLVQEVLTSVFETWRRRGAPADEAARIAYARVSLVRQSIRSARRWAPERHTLPDDDAGAELAGPDADQMSAVWQVVGRLRPDERAAVVLHHYLDLPFTQVAEHLGCRVGTARSLCSRALVKVRLALENDTATDPPMTIARATKRSAP